MSLITVKLLIACDWPDCMGWIGVMPDEAPDKALKDVQSDECDDDDGFHKWEGRGSRGADGMHRYHLCGHHRDKTTVELESAIEAAGPEARQAMIAELIGQATGNYF